MPDDAGVDDAGPDDAVVAIVHGHVQGVGFRWTTRSVLERLGLRGGAENLPDGTVRVEATGAASDIEALLTWLRGPGTPGRVTQVDVTRR